jgi:hypothetical protein
MRKSYIPSTWLSGLYIHGYEACHHPLWKASSISLWLESIHANLRNAIVNILRDCIEREISIEEKHMTPCINKCNVSLNVAQWLQRSRREAASIGLNTLLESYCQCPVTIKYIMKLSIPSLANGKCESYICEKLYHSRENMRSCHAFSWLYSFLEKLGLIW